MATRRGSVAARREALGLTQEALAQHPAFAESIQRLTGIGISVMDPDAVTVRADDGLATFVWAEIISARAA
ncbi:hypothetical protein GCM10010470_23930 [Saccharopolyspora taberi]|uniref:Uncharacterized protein n=1 Tax=Saccharopolyspora taberi TaxID=60895 RepID=A0ABN3VB96_9PSEU